MKRWLRAASGVEDAQTRAVDVHRQPKSPLDRSAISLDEALVGKLVDRLTPISREASLRRGMASGLGSSGRNESFEENARDIHRRVIRAPSSVLLAENALDMRRMIKFSLMQDGYDVNDAADGSEVLDLLRTALSFPFRMPDVIVMDVVMPRYSGLSILSAIRKANWVTPVIMMSAIDDDSIVSKAKSLGAAAFFKQPFDIDDLRTAVIAASARHDTATVRKKSSPSDD